MKNSLASLFCFRLKPWLFLVAFLFCVIAKGTDTLYVESYKDERYLLYLDSLKAYETGYKVAKSIADSVRHMTGNSSYDSYFLRYYEPEKYPTTEGLFVFYEENPNIEPGHVSDQAKFLWTYVKKQYLILDQLKVAPVGVMQGAELPSVYIYKKPTIVTVVRIIKRYTVVDPSIKFLIGRDGKTKTSYIIKYHYSKEGEHLQQIDSIEKLDPQTREHLYFKDE